MPGLLRMAGRTAVVAGTATAVSGRVARRQEARYQDQAQAQQQQEWEQQQQWAQQQQAAAPPPPAAPAAGDMSSSLEQLKQLGDLHASGVLTDEEFAAQKAKLLGS